MGDFINLTCFFLKYYSFSRMLFVVTLTYLVDELPVYIGVLLCSHFVLRGHMCFESIRFNIKLPQPDI